MDGHAKAEHDYGTSSVAQRPFPYLRARANEGPLDLNKMSAEGHSMVDDRRTLLLLNITIPHHANFSVKTSTSYHLQGEIIRLEDDGTIAFDVEHNPENQPIAGHELVDLGPVKVDGIGRISSVEFTHRTRGRSFWELQLDHEHRGSRTDAIRVRYLVPVEDLDVPSNTNFRLGSRIGLIGYVVSLGRDGAVMTVQVGPFA
ncbi:hypothetical protein H4Q26_015783 [Puccinia striiformis f. sp. tritici PST-130]|nr:hypothetical protein H4Q26_015783 [Puccinia striiformis f. sp. tritici PST-130]